MSPTMHRGPRLLVLALATAFLAAPAVDAQEGSPPKQERKAKSAVDDLADTRVHPSEVGSDVGKGTRFARKPLQPGAYFNDRSRAAVRKYYAAHPPRGKARRWQIGEQLPGGAATRPVPPPLLKALPKLPPGHAYVLLAGDILLVANSGMVVDGIAAR